MISHALHAPSPSPLLNGSAATATAKINNDPGHAKASQSMADSNAHNVREQQQIQQLQQRDNAVRAHEAAHLAAAGSLALGGANYSYQKGPDGERYAIGGDVRIDISKVPGDPEATLAKSEQIQRAALAPVQPSSQDITIANQAARMAAEARHEIRQQQRNPEQGETQQHNAIQHYHTPHESPQHGSQLNLYA